MKEIVVLRKAGIPLFHYSVDNTERLDVLVSAFLSTVGTIAEQSGEHEIRAISFSESKFVWESKGDLYLIALVSLDDSTAIYRVILQYLAEQFVSSFYSELRHDNPRMAPFRAFTDTVEATLQKFDGIPGLARKYKTGLLPPLEMRRLKLALAETDGKEWILRGGFLTFDGHILSSNLRSYELEAFLDLMTSVCDKVLKSGKPLVITHTSLDAATAFFVERFRDVGVCVFTVKRGKEADEYSRLIESFMILLASFDFSNMRKFSPQQRRESAGFYEFDTVLPTMTLTEAMEGSGDMLESVPKPVRGNVVSLLKQIDGRATFAEMMSKASLTSEELSAALAFLIAKGMAKVAQLFPVMGPRDERFAAYLEVVGMPKRDYEIVDAVWGHCTGGYSLREIAQKTGIPAARIVEVLRSLKSYVVWETERVLAQIR